MYPGGNLSGGETSAISVVACHWLGEVAIFSQQMQLDIVDTCASLVYLKGSSVGVP